MTIALGLFLYVATVIIHEIGHLVAMKQRGVKIEELGIGKPIRKLKLTFRPKFLPFAVVLGPIPDGAYVLPTKKGYKRLKKMSYEDAAICYSAGVISNIAFAGILALITLPIVLFRESYTESVILIAVFCIALATVAFRRFVSMVVVPVVGALGFIALIATLVYLGIVAINTPHTAIGSYGFLIHAPTLLEALYFGIGISLLLAVGNMFPNPPFDGNHVLRALLKKWKLKKRLIENILMILWLSNWVIGVLLFALVLLVLFK
jgi:Zn-dependent protease